MVNSIVSIRLPKKLVEELKIISEENHYMDLSEAVRGILRQTYMEKTNKLELEITKLKREIKESIDNTRKEKIVSELKLMLEEISNEAKSQKDDDKNVSNRQ